MERVMDVRDVHGAVRQLEHKLDTLLARQLANCESLQEVVDGLGDVLGAVVAADRGKWPHLFVITRDRIRTKNPLKLFTGLAQNHLRLRMLCEFRLDSPGSGGGHEQLCHPTSHGGFEFVLWKKHAGQLARAFQTLVADNKLIGEGGKVAAGCFGLPSVDVNEVLNMLHQYTCLSTSDDGKHLLKSAGESKVARAEVADMYALRDMMQQAKAGDPSLTEEVCGLLRRHVMLQDVVGSMAQRMWLCPKHYDLMQEWDDGCISDPDSLKISARTITRRSLAERRDSRRAAPVQWHEFPSE